MDEIGSQSDMQKVIIATALTAQFLSISESSKIWEISFGRSWQPCILKNKLALDITVLILRKITRTIWQEAAEIIAERSKETRREDRSGLTHSVRLSIREPGFAAVEQNATSGENLFGIRWMAFPVVTLLAFS